MVGNGELVVHGHSLLSTKLGVASVRETMDDQFTRDIYGSSDVHIYPMSPLSECPPQMAKSTMNNHRSSADDQVNLDIHGSPNIIMDIRN